MERPLPALKAPRRDNYGSFLERIAVVHVIGSPRLYNLLKIQQAIVDQGVPPSIIEGLCPMDMGKKWHIRFTRVEDRDRFVAKLRTLEVKINGQINECPITSYYDDLRVVRVRGLGLGLPEDVLYEYFAPYGELKLAIPERSKGLFTIYNGNYLCSLKVHSEESFLDLPDEATITIEGEEVTLSFVAFGVPPRCHRCKLRGHVRANCTTRCSHCGSGDHLSEDHPQREASDPTPAEALRAAQAAEEANRAAREQQRALRQQKDEEMKQQEEARQLRREEKQRAKAQTEGDSQVLLPGQSTPKNNESELSDDDMSPDLGNDSILSNESLSELESAEQGDRKRKNSGSETPAPLEKKSAGST